MTVQELIRALEDRQGDLPVLVYVGDAPSHVPIHQIYHDVITYRAGKTTKRRPCVVLDVEPRRKA